MSFIEKVKNDSSVHDELETAILKAMNDVASKHGGTITKEDLVDNSKEYAKNYSKSGCSCWARSLVSSF